MIAAVLLGAFLLAFVVGPLAYWAALGCPHADDDEAPR